MSREVGIVFTGGACPEFDVIRQCLDVSDIIVAADSGWDSAVGMGIKPDVFIGDMDSVINKEGVDCLEKENVFLYERDKDYTDTELALKYLKDGGFKRLILIGGGEGRLDHLLAIVASFNMVFRPDEWITAMEHIFYIDSRKEFVCNIDQTISLFSSSCQAAVVSSKGLKWELDEYVLNDKNISVSNCARLNRVTIEVLSGSVLAILQL